MHRVDRIAAGLAAALALLFAAPAAAQETLTEETYLTPPEAVAEAVLAPWHENISPEDPSPDGQFLVITERDRRMPPLALLAKKHYNLGGLQIDPRANRSRRLTTRSPDALRLLSTRDGESASVRVPRGAKVSSVRWAPDGSRIAFLAHFEDATHVYVADAETGQAWRVTEAPVLATLARPLDWSGDGRYIFTVLVPEDRGAEPAAPEVARTPRVSVTSKGENVLRTYPDLLETPHDHALLEYYATGQLARIDVERNGIRTIGEPALIDGIDAAPDGRHVLVRRLAKPFPDFVPVYSFERIEEVWDLEGDRLAEIARRPIRDGTDDDDENGDRPRDIAWRPDGAGLSFLQRAPAADSGDAEEDSEARGDRVMQWTAPFDSASRRVIFEHDREIRGVRYDAEATTLFVTERHEGDETLFAVSPDAPDTRHTIYRHDADDIYDDPGDPLTVPNARGVEVVRTSADGGSIYLSGTRYPETPLEDAPRPFLDRVAIESGEATRLFESAEDRYERVVAVAGAEADRIVITRETPNEVPDAYVLDLGSGDERRLTDNRNHSPDLTTEARRETFMVERPDGVRFRVRVALPASWEPGTRLPAMFWFYPREFEDQDAYDEWLSRRHNRNAFPSVGTRSMDILLRRGYAVVRPDLPIVGPRRTWNNEYVPSLLNGLSAAIDTLDHHGYIDRGRLAIGGHSYGGFGTINALIRTPFFQAGIAGAANSNRTLTPAGFQRERRTLWEARGTYMRMSPIFWMDELDGALLLYHGMEDQNVGTFPIHSPRALHALNALDKTAALYMYPYEAHGPRAAETVLDLWTRWVTWLDTHVKNAGQAATAAADANGAAVGAEH